MYYSHFLYTGVTEICPEILSILMVLEIQVVEMFSQKTFLR